MPAGQWRADAMDQIDILMIAAAGYVAVVSLVRLMAARRDQVIRQLRAEIERRRAEAAQAEHDRDAA
jgi:hypothetical protein